MITKIIKEKTAVNILKKAGAKRVSKEAAKEFCRYINKQSQDMAFMIKATAFLDLRKTIQKKDVDEIIKTEKDKHKNWET
jgi:histone H3/H4